MLVKLQFPTVNLNLPKVQCMITMHARSRQTDGQKNIMAIAQRFVVTNASRANNNDVDDDDDVIGMPSQHPSV